MGRFTVDLLNGNIYLFSGDFTGSGSTPTSGSTYPEVNVFSSLPTPVSSSGEIYVVRNGSGTTVLNRKPAGFYYSTGAVWRYLGDIPDGFLSNNFQVVDSVDNTKGVMFETSGITTNEFRTLTIQNNDGTIAYLIDLDTKVDTSIFNSYTGITAPNTFVNWTIFSGYTGTTDILITNLRTDVDTLSGHTQEDINNTISAGMVSGGTFYDNGDGSISVSGGSAYFKETNNAIGVTKIYEFSANTNVSLVDRNVNYIYISYTDGNPIIASSISNVANGRTSFNLGLVYRQGIIPHIFESGLWTTETTKRTQQRFVEQFGMTRTNGGIISETGTLNIASTGGVWYSGLNRGTTISQNTSIGDTFRYYYYSGSSVGWIRSDEVQINNTQYNDVATGLVDLASQQYGVHWVYIDNDGHLLVVYGQNTYTLNESQTAQPPASLPIHVADFSTFAAKIIIKKSGVVFSEIQSAWDIHFTPSLVGLHNELSGIQGGIADNYYHLTSAEYALVPDISGNTANIATNAAAITTKLDLDATIVSLTANTTITTTYKGKIIEGDGTFTITLPDSMDTGMRVDIVNVGVGTITIAATTTLLSKNGAVTLANQYGSGSVYHRGGNVWLLTGDLS